MHWSQWMLNQILLPHGDDNAPAHHHSFPYNNPMPDNHSSITDNHTMPDDNTMPDKRTNHRRCAVLDGSV